MTYSQQPRKLRRFVTAALAVSLCIGLGMPAGKADTVTEKSVRDAVLERYQYATNDLSGMDMNTDAKVDVADLVKQWIAFPTIPAASFATSDTQTEEGRKTCSVLVEFSRPFFGYLHYGVGGTAISGTNYQHLSGSAEISGLFGYIPITLIDNQTAEDTVKTIRLDIDYAPNDGFGYTLGPTATHYVRLVDNDSWWRGEIRSGAVSLHFNMKLIGGSSGWTGIVRGDGTGIIPPNTDGTPRDWPVTVTQLSGSLFQATLGPMTIPATHTGIGESLERSFVLTADATRNGDTVEPSSQLNGECIERVRCAKAQFNRDLAGGRFVLLRSIPRIEPEYPPLVTLP